MLTVPIALLRCVSDVPGMIGWPEEGYPTMRNMPLPKAIYGGLPDVYPIFHPLTLGRTE